MYRDNRSLAVRRAVWGGAVRRARHHRLLRRLRRDRLAHASRASSRLGDLTFLAGSFLRLRTLLEQLLLGFSQIAGQALYLDDLFSFFDIKPPDHVARRSHCPSRCRSAQGIVFENVGFRYPDSERWAVRDLNLTLHAGESWRWSARTAPARPPSSSC